MSIPGSDVPLLLAQPAATGYQIQRSLRFNSSDSAFLSKTYSTARSGTDCTLSFWIKRHKLGTDQVICATARSGGNQRFLLKFLPSDRLHLVTAGGGYYFTFHPALRDCSAWYHIHWKWDTRDLIWINGVQYSSDNIGIFGGHEWHTHVDAYSNVMQHGIGYHPSNIYETPAPEYGNYTLAEFHSLDNINAPVSSFGETNATTGQWVPKAYTGSYGTNGFRLTFSDNSGTTATTLGKDAAGSNNWTPTNFSVASGAGNDSLVDTPTSYGTDTGAGGEVRGNYATLNPLMTTSANSGGGLATLTNGNLEAQSTLSAYRNTYGTVAFPSSGKYYFEATLTTTNGQNNQSVGIASLSDTSKIFLLDCFATSSTTARKNVDTIFSGTYSTVGAGTVVQIAVDCDNGKAYLGFSNTWIDSSSPTGNTGGYSMATGQTYAPFFSGYNCGITSFNFGQRPFAYTAPSGFKALCDTNLPVPTIAKPSTAFDVVTYTGTGATLTATSSLGFSPDLVWIKSRSAATDNTLYDAVRGAQARLESNNTDAEITSDGGLTAFNSNGFTLGTLAQVNTNTATYVAWCWDEAAADGFDIVTYTGNGANRTIAHSLGVAPSFMIVKQRTTATTTNWAVWHSSLANTEYLLLNTTAAKATGATYWNSTSPTGSVFSLGTSADVNTNSGNYVAYLWSPVAGYSSFGSYTGNGSTDGPFVYTGFRPRWVMLKQSSGSGTGWQIHDTSRNTYNVMNNRLQPNNSAAESTYTTSDFLSNGFKLRDSDPSWNSNGPTYIYAAFAENPFAYARAR